MNGSLKYSKPKFILEIQSNSALCQGIGKKQERTIKYSRTVHDSWYAIRTLGLSIGAKSKILGLLFLVSTVSLSQHLTQFEKGSQPDTYAVQKFLKPTNFHINHDSSCSSKTVSKTNGVFRLADYFKPDLGFYYHWNGSKVSHVVSVDVQNLASNNLEGFIYNEKSKELEKSSPFFLVPFIKYRLKF